MEQEFEKLTLIEENVNTNKIELTIEEYTVKTKIDTRPFKINFPKEIVEFILQDENFSPDENTQVHKIDKEKLNKILFQNEDKTIELTDNPYITDQLILKAIFTFLGSVNGISDPTQISTNEQLSEIEDENCIENFSDKNYSDYIHKNIPLIFSQFKLKDLEPLMKSLKWMGIDLSQLSQNESKNESLIYNSIKRFIQEENKILIVITPNNNFWIKSEKHTIGNHNYDKKINNFSFVFYNWQFIKKFYDRVGNHPRCSIGFLNSMILKNLKPCIDSIPIQVKNFTKFVIFDQNSHEVISTNNNKEKPVFNRSLDKMKSALKVYENYEKINETNIIILESEKDKISPNSSHNSIVMNLFSEEVMNFNQSEREEIDIQGDRMLNYLVKLLDECDGDVREYIMNNPL